MKFPFYFFLFLIILTGCSSHEKFDLLIRGATVVDGSGAAAFTGDIAVNADTIVKIGDLRDASGRREIDASGLVVAPGFINVLSWANVSLIADGRSQSDIRQGVTLEILGEGDSMGPLNEKMKEDMTMSQGDIKYDIGWNTLGEYLDFLEKKGVSANIASFVGATTLRIYAMGYENRDPTTAELDTMKLLLKQAMEEGAVGLSSALQYAPASFSKPEELTSLCRIVKEYDGLYISHIRDEGIYILPSLDELIATASESGVRAEVYHLKQSGSASWEKLDAVIAKIDSARKAGIELTADMYNYIASSTGFDIVMPGWVQEGGIDKWVERLKDEEVRKAIAPDIRNGLYSRTGSAEKVLLVSFNNDSLKYLTGKTLAWVSEKMNKSPEETVMDLVINDHGHVGVVYFSMSEENIRREIALPWMSFCSDAGSYSPEGLFLKSGTHPRAYGNFARLLGRYVREEKVITLEEAVRKLTSLPAANLKIERRGALKPGYYADIVIFDPETIQDHATFENPHQFATGMHFVFVNGVMVLGNGEHTGAMPGRVVRGPGWKNN